MSVQPNPHIQTQLDRIGRELTTLQNRRGELEGQQTRIDLLRRFQQQGVTRPFFESFQQARRHPLPSLSSKTVFLVD